MTARLLVVEDDPASLDLMAYLLGKAGYEVARATNGREGLDAIRTEHPDLVIMDVQMPELDGLDAIRELRSDPELRGAVVVAVTAVAMVGDKERVLAAGFDGYLAKPITPETFVTQVEQFLDESLQSGIVLPATRRVGSGGGESPAEVVDTTSTGALVLIVDDTGENLALLLDLLESSGYRVEAARSAKEALAAARRTRPDLVITDFHMPDADGADLVTALHSDPHLVGVPTVILSSSAMDRYEQERVRNAGAADVIVRPLDPPALLARIEATLAPTGGRGSG